MTLSSSVVAGPLGHTPWCDGLRELVPDTDDLPRRIASLRGKIEAIEPDLGGSVNDVTWLRDLLARVEDAMIERDRCRAYLQLRSLADVADSEAAAWLPAVATVSFELDSLIAHLDQRWLSLDIEDRETLAAAPELKRYVPHLARVSTTTGRSTPRAAASALRAMSPTSLDRWVQLYARLVTEITIDDGAGGETSLRTAQSRLPGLGGRDRVDQAKRVVEGLRPTAWARCHAFASVLLQHAAADRIRGREHWLEGRVQEDGLSLAEVDSALNAVDRTREHCHDYFRRAIPAGTPRPSLLDIRPRRTSPLSVPLGAALDLIITTLSEADPELAVTARDLVAAGRIDAEIRSGKQPGAFTEWAIPEVQPFVHVSYDGSTGSVRTLAHEIGHAVHFRLARHHGPFGQIPALPLSEAVALWLECGVASRLEPGAPDVVLETIVTNLFRQAALIRFEDSCHEMARAGGPLTVESIDSLWEESMTWLHGPGIDVSPSHLGWSVIPHIVAAPGYAYAYVVAQLGAAAILRRTRRTGLMPPALIEVMKAGNTVSTRDAFRALLPGCSTTDIWQLGIDEACDLLDEKGLPS